jgi:restriction system protein
MTVTGCPEGSHSVRRLVPMANGDGQFIRGRKVVEGTKLTLQEWLALLHDRTICLYPTIAFPTDEMRAEYLRTIGQRDTDEVLDLLRQFLVPTCTLQLEREGFRALREYGIQVPTERHRRMAQGGPAWEGLTWVIDLLKRSPRRAIEVLDAYADTHIQELDMGWWPQRLYDAMALIRAKWIEAEHPEDILVSLGWDKLERLVQCLYAEMGFETRRTQRSHDGGIDIWATYRRAGQRQEALIQCKCSRKNVGVLKVRELHGAVEDAKASKGVLVCARGFTPDARKWVKRNPRLELVGAGTLTQLLNENLGSDWPQRIDYHTSEVSRLPRDATPAIASATATPP